MPLPGKLTVGFLQEDNPVKAYFRMKPMYVLEEEGFCAVDAQADAYPEDGFIRIVPDKNELLHFKNRMRQLGRYCALDLRKFPNENEKIRPNKNYGSGAEKNASIVYSDVIGPLPEDLALEALDAQYVFLADEITLRTPLPGTRFVLVRREGQLTGPWTWSEAADVAGCVQLRRIEGCRSVPEGECEQHLLRLGEGGAAVTLMTNLEPFRAAIEAYREKDAQGAPEPAAETAAPESAPAPSASPEAPAETPAEAPAPEAAAEQPAAEAPAAEPEPTEASGAALPAEAPAPDAAPEAVEPTETAADKAARPAKPVRAPKAPLKFEQRPEALRPEPAKPEPAKPEPIKPEQPWLQKTEMPRPRAISGRLSLREQTMQAQIGINPRKGRSLSEVVDEGWRRSRYDQLGHPVPPEASCKPVLSPIERAVEDVKEAWKLQNARKGLLEGLLGDAEIRDGIAQCLNINIERGALNENPDSRADDMQAERLKLMNEIDALRIRRADMKTSLMEELRQSHKQEFDKYSEKNRAMLQEAERNEKAAQSAKMAAEAAEQLLHKTSEQIEQQLLGHLMTERAIELVMHMNDKRILPAQHPETYEPTAGELISDLRVQLESAGFALDNDDAVNLLSCMMTGGMVIVSGPSGSGKSQLVRQLAAALGLTGPARRFVEVQTPSDEAVKALLDNCDGLTPAIVLLDDINLSDSDDAVNEAIRLQEEALAKGLPLCLMLTVQDAPDGRPLSARLLTRAFLIRLDPASAASRWKPPTLLDAKPERAVALSAIRAILAPVSDLGAEAESRLNALRDQLEKIGYNIDRRTLNELWRYCASVGRASRLTGMQALDRALAQRAVPAMLASMNIEQLTALPGILCDLPDCMKMIDQPLPLPPL